MILVAAAPLAGSPANGQTISPVENSGAGSASAGPMSSPNPFGNLNYFNWSDLPFTLNAGQTFGYNSNVLGIPQGVMFSPLGSPSRGDLFSTTNVGMSWKANVGAQQFFADGSYGITRYKTDVADDTHQYSFDAGVNWQVTSRCSGRLVAAANQFQSPIDEQVGVGINSVTLNSFNETGKCLITGYISGVLDSGISDTTNSNIADALNDYRAKFVRGGFQYAVTGYDLVSLLTTVTQRDFTNRGDLMVFGLANQTTQIDYQLQYNKIFSPRFSFEGMVGVTQIAIMSADSTQEFRAQFDARILRFAELSGHPEADIRPCSLTVCGRADERYIQRGTQYLTKCDGEL